MRKSEIRVAVIDLGTNSLRAEVYRGDLSAYAEGNRSTALERIHRERHMPRLGRGLYESGRLNPDGCRETLELLKELRERLREFEVEEIAAAATSAIREAEDGDRFVEALTENADLPFRVLSGIEEAAYTAQGILAFEPEVPSPSIFVDIGGGSTELSLYREGASTSYKSLPLGAIRHNFRFLRCSPQEEKPPLPEAVEAMRAELASILQAEIPDWRSTLLIGSSGTVRTLAKISGALAAPGEVMNFSQLDGLSALLAGCGFSERCKIEGLEENRADIIVAGAVILEELFKHLDADQLRASLYSLRHGLLDELLRRRL